MLVKDILAFLKEKFPLETACDYDNVGLLVGSPTKNVSHVILSLDCTMEAIDKAVANGCGLIITHHPVIFGGIKTVLDDSVVYRLIKNDISLISMHTNLDSGDGGVNDCLCAALGISDVYKVDAGDGLIVRAGKIVPMQPDALAKHIKIKLSCSVRYYDTGRSISRVLVCSGSGGELVPVAQNEGCDALITADVKHHQFLSGGLNGIAVFDAGHYHTEQVAMKPLAGMLSLRFSDVTFETVLSDSLRFV